MKIRKLIPLLLVALVALVALSSCDNILAGLFNLNQNVAGNNTLTVNINTYYSSVGTDIYYGDLVVVLYDVTTSSVVGTPRHFSLNYLNVDPIQASADFSNLKGDTYAAYAWIDYNGDNQPTGDWDYDSNWGYTSYTFGSSASNAIADVTANVYDMGYGYGNTIHFTY